MTHVCCPSCRLRFTRAAAARLIACPECAGAVEPLSTRQALGFRLLSGDVRVNGETEERRGRQLRRGDVVSVAGMQDVRVG